MSYGYTAPALASQQGQPAEGLDPAYIEEIKKCVNNGRLSISIEGIYTLIRNKITVGRGKSQLITPMDVITVLKTAVSAGLDPTSDDVFAFKTDDRTIVGISKKGWSKIVDTRKSMGQQSPHEALSSHRALNGSASRSRSMTARK